ncbi:hypothetical protein ONZ45_g11160 [Pleurotus djamor]|nr:hypothetical protein ONZ45_g11160 [Pleurotus djamor]
MAPHPKELPPGLEEALGTDGTPMILCQLCTKAGSRRIVFKRTSRSSHLKSDGHKRALQDLHGSSDQPTQSSESTPPAHTPIVLSLLQQCEETAEGPSQSFPDPTSIFDSVMDVGEDGWIDGDGDVVMFTAGTDDNSEVALRERERLALVEQINQLDLLADYSHLGDMGTSAEEIGLDLEDDPNSDQFGRISSSLGLDDETELHEAVTAKISDTASEFWHGGKWLHEAGNDELSPMWANWKKSPHRHYFVSELAQCHDGSLVLLLKWVTVRGEVHAQVCNVFHSELNNVFDIADPAVRYISADTLVANALDLSTSYPGALWSEIASQQLQQREILNPLRKKSKLPMFRIRVMPWCDDVSGNVSKQYNPHTNAYIQNVNIPHKKLSQEYYVRFVATSPHASASEIVSGFSEDFDNDIWHPAYDCELEQDILFQIIPHILPADNPQQAELSSHIGLKGNYFCRRDSVGGSSQEKESTEGYNTLFQPGAERHPGNTVESIRSQLFAACSGNMEAVQSLQTQTGVKDKLAQHWVEIALVRAREQQDTQINNIATRDARLNDKRIKGDQRKAVKQTMINTIQVDVWNWLVRLAPPSRSQNSPPGPLQDIVAGFHFNSLLLCRGEDLNPHKDTTVEILHSFLLGNDKYIWHETSSPWDKKKEATFAVRLQSSNLDGLSTAAPRPQYLVKYKNSLIGKHFKYLQQVAVFHATGELGAHLWIAEISEMDLYIADLKALVANLLDAWSIFDPNRIVVKAKLHILTHLAEDVRRFGSAILYSTEVFECWNAIFRMCSILSNHLAPSRDIATTLIHMERFKHQVSGGWWKNESGHMVRSGVMIRSFLATTPELQRRLGWVEAVKIKPGSVTLSSAPSRLNRDTVQVSWSQLMSQIQPPVEFQALGEGTVDSQDMRDDINSDMIREGSVLHQQAIVVIEHFHIRDCRDQIYNMPVMDRSGELRIIRPAAMQFKFNAQHDCQHHGCSVVEGAHFVSQERLPTSIPLQTVKHTNEDSYLINMHALHNSHLLRAALPRSLTEPIPLVLNRDELHLQQAAKLQVSGPAKRAEAREKAKATREQNKKKKLGATTTSQLTAPSIVPSTAPEEHEGETIDGQELQ